MITKYLSVLIIFIFSFAHSEEKKNYPWLETLDPYKDYKESGERLTSLDFGLWPIEKLSGEEKVLLISVHGSKSPGYEWIYPLQTLDSKKTSTFFYRWNDEECYLNSAKKLNAHISGAIKKYRNLEKIILIGHSYGGILVTSMAGDWNHFLPVEIHSIAGPVGLGFSSGACSYVPPKEISTKAFFYQWRTQHHLDGAFRRLKEDPQILSLKGSKVARLPETYRGRRLGHNWSISWVADYLKENYDY